MTKRIAIITGASSGLGAEYLKQLRNDPEIDEFWVIARRRERLEQLKTDISDKARPIPMDLTSKEDLHCLAEMLNEEKPDIRLLINNAGLGKIASADDTEEQDVDSMIDLNCKAAVHISMMCVPLMHKGARILITASIAGFQPLPPLAVYAATKAFILSYGKSLHYELKPKGIHVTTVCPYWIKDTEFIPTAKQTGTPLFRHTPCASLSTDVVRTSLKDSRHNRMVSTPGFITSAERVLSGLIPDALLMPIMDIASKL